MFRIKVAASLIFVFAISAVLVYNKTSESIEHETRAQMEQQLRLARRNLERVRRLDAFAVVAKTSQIAEWAQLGEILTRTPESFADEEGNLPTADDFSYEVHRLMNQEVGAWQKKFEALSADKNKASTGLNDYRTDRPDLFVVLDAMGVGVSKSDDPAWYGEAEANLLGDYPVLKKTLTDGQSLQDIWVVKGAPMTVASVPVRHGKRVVGAVVIGYRMTDAAAKRDRTLVDADVAYFLGTRLKRSSSLDTASERILQTLLVEQKLMDRIGEPAPIEFILNGTKHLAFVGALEGNETAEQAGFLVVGNLGAAEARTGEVMVWIPVVALLGFMLAYGLVLVFYQRQVKPFEEIDQGVMEIINGNLDYWFDVPGDEMPGTMSQNLNIMVCQLSGRPLPEEDDAREGEHWAEERMFINEISSKEFHTEPVVVERVRAGEVGNISRQVVQLVLEDEATYQRRTFREYTAALRSANKPVQGITFEKFTQHLETNAVGLREKYKCADVRFLVDQQEDRVALKPIPMS